jgi:hypothetical protein
VSSNPREDVVEEAMRLLSAAESEGLPLRALGGLAVHLRTQGVVPLALARSYGDIDLVTPKGSDRRVSQLLVEMGYQPNERFNAWSESRLIFHDVSHQRRIDVFVGEFRMCHRIRLIERIELEGLTVPLAELLLTKLQVVRLNQKDLVDIYALLYAHEVGEVDAETINAGEIARQCAADWGLWRTSSNTLNRTREHLTQSGLTETEQSRIDKRIQHLQQRIEAEPKSLRWKGRARLGERVKWYEEPEEIEHAGQDQG